jgi:PGF-CTERM protein
MNTRTRKAGVLVFAILFVMSVQIVIADEFDDAELIDAGDFSHYGSYCYRIWIDDPGYELCVSISSNTTSKSPDTYLAIHNPSKEPVFVKNTINLEEKYGVLTERGWYYIRSACGAWYGGLYSHWDESWCNITVTTNPPNPDKFKVWSLNIVPENAYEDEEILISFDVKNNGQWSDTCAAELIIDGVTKDTKEVEIDGGETETITFNIVADEEGTHNVEVSVSPIWSSSSKEINGAYTVEHTLTPAKFEVSNLAIAPERGDIGDIVKITVDVANVGEVEGTYDVELHVDGRLEDSKMVTLSGGETKSVAFTIAEDYAGSYSVEVDGLSGAFEIVSPVSTPRATFTPKPTVKPASTSSQTSKPFTPTAHTKPVTPIFVRLDSINDVYIGENLIVTGTCNREEGYTIVVTCNGPAELFPEIAKIENGKFKAIFDTNDAQIGTYIVKADDGEENIDKTTVNIFAESIKTPTPTKRPSSASVNLYGEKTDVVLGEDILLRLSAVNLITKPPMSVQVIIIPPSGMSVTSAEFAETIAGQYSATYKLEPGKGRDVGVRIKSNPVGDFVVEGRIVYYFGGDKTTGEDHTLTLPIKVRSVETTPTSNPAPSETPSPTPPGFEAIFAIAGLLAVAFLVRRKE